MRPLHHFFLSLCFLVSALVGCGGSGGSSGGGSDVSAVPTASVRFGVEGLAEGGQLVLQNAGIDILTLHTNGSQAMNMPIGQNLSIAAGTQPKDQYCALHKNLVALPTTLQATVEADMPGMQFNCADLVDLTQLYGLVNFDWVDDVTSQTVSHSAYFSAAALTQDASGLLLTAQLSSDFSWQLSCFALEDGTQTYNPSQHLCIMLNQAGDAHLLAFQRRGSQWVDGRHVSCQAQADISSWAMDCADALRNSMPGNLAGGVQIGQPLDAAVRSTQAAQAASPGMAKLAGVLQQALKRKPIDQ